jgi:hypothetical protein
MLRDRGNRAKHSLKKEAGLERKTAVAAAAL